MSTSIRDNPKLDTDQLRTDPKSRRRIQNRNAQRNTRLRRAVEKQKASAAQAQQTNCRCCCPHQISAVESEDVSASLVPKAGLNAQETVLPTPKTVKSPHEPQTMAMNVMGDPGFFVEMFGSPTANLRHGFSRSPSDYLSLNVALESSDEDVSPTLPDSHPRTFEETRRSSEASANQDVNANSSSNDEWSLSNEYLPADSINGAPNPRDQSKKPGFTQRKTPLHASALSGNYTILQMLLRRGAKVNATDDTGRTALHYGVEMGHADVVRVLLEHKADAGIVDNQGLSAMHLAVVNNQETVVVLLLELGVSPDV
ncbi:hypothetical protein QQS21_003932 [Conoideocrella luteorostrata]|uniref:BZIP domain-containing protein n=1 Tax=Conoideocrella luteorostrata TaxID=1105319 RepID=A0AAJ0G075_9HYPO|nr:hypothetical protein QQS21_003932 [Conoideocrella luteorostrata]